MLLAFSPQAPNDDTLNYPISFILAEENASVLFLRRFFVNRPRLL
jgi:hypothetical protein